MKNIITTILTALNLTTSGESSAVDTVGTRDARNQDATFYLNVSSLTGTSPTLDVDIVSTINGVDHVEGSFTQATGATKERLSITNCPDSVKAVYTMGGTVTDADFTVDCARR